MPRQQVGCDQQAFKCYNSFIISLKRLLIIQLIPEYKQQPTVMVSDAKWVSKVSLKQPNPYGKAACARKHRHVGGINIDQARLGYPEDVFGIRCLKQRSSRPGSAGVLAGELVESPRKASARTPALPGSSRRLLRPFGF